MPIYTYRCQTCEHQFETVLRLAEYDDPQACPECAATPAKRIIASSVGFVLRGDGWAGKNLKVKGQMARRRERLADKEREQRHDNPGMRLAPNVGGERVDSWAEAKKLAKSKGKDTSSYDGVIRS
jgi:putative FmdB family regulatory protein